MIDTKIFFLIVLYTNLCVSQIKGKCIDSLGIPIPYANLGIKNTEIGTVTDVYGNFKLDNESLTDKNNLIITHVGYTPKSIIVNNNVNIEITLNSANYELEEVTIVSSKYKFNKQKRIGNNVLTEHVVVGFFSRNLGAEVGKYFSVSKGKKYKIEKIHFNVSELGYKKGTFRVNFYNAINGKAIENIRKNDNDIIMEVSKTGDVNIDVTDESLIFENDFVVAIELIDLVDNTPPNTRETRKIYFSSNVFCGPYYSRSNNVSNWKESKQKYNLGLGIQLFVKY